MDLPQDAQATVGRVYQTAVGPVNFFGNATMAFLGTFGPGTLAGATPEIAGLSIFKNTPVVINWAHRITEVRAGHLPPSGSAEEVTAAVEKAINRGLFSYRSGAQSGLIEGRVVINGVENGFTGRIVGGVARISSVFRVVK